MIANSNVTIYHKTIKNHLEEWTRYNFNNIWFFGGKGARVNKGYDNANDVEVRIPLNLVDLKLQTFAIGDIIVEGSLDFDITSQQALKEYQIYNITSININNFGLNPHIHLGGK